MCVGAALSGWLLGFWYGVPLVSAGCRVRLRGVPLARWREGYTRTLHYCVVQGYDQARHSVASVMAVCYWAGGVPPWLLVWGRYRAVGVPSWLLVWGCWADAGAP